MDVPDFGHQVISGHPKNATLERSVAAMLAASSDGAAQAQGRVEQGKVAQHESRCRRLRPCEAGGR